MLFASALETIEGFTPETRAYEGRKVGENARKSARSMSTPS